jgi:hypothetical protein
MKTKLVLLAISLALSTVAKADICTKDVKETHFIKTSWNKNGSSVMLLYCPKAEPSNCERIGPYKNYTTAELDRALALTLEKTRSMNDKSLKIFGYGMGSGVIATALTRSISGLAIGTVGGLAGGFAANSLALTYQEANEALHAVTFDTFRRDCYETPLSAADYRERLGDGLRLIELEQMDSVKFTSEAPPKKTQTFADGFYESGKSPLAGKVYAE